MTDEAEVERLKAELELHRQRELAELREALAAAREAAIHYRNECARIADSAKQLVAEYEKDIVSLKTQLMVRANVLAGGPQK